jgi:uncharacterized protein with ParB-like and HNH nuclease domain
MRVPMNIKPFDWTIQTIFEAGFYKIPRFQRPYAWDRGNIEEFWSDVIASGASDYFIGSMVFYKPKGRQDIQVVDGQQRLTTITIFLAALRDTFADAGEIGLAKGVQNVIQRRNVDNELRFVLLTETSYPFFQEYVQKFGEPDLDFSPSPEEAGIQSAYEYVKERFEQIVRMINENPSLNEDRRIRRTKRDLQSIRDTLLSLRVIVIELDSEDDAYVIFETLNTRGKDLEPEDLVKNHLARLLPARSADVDATRTRWGKITRSIWESDANLDVSTYIRHFWLSREEYTSKKTLFKRIKASVNKTNAKNFLRDLEDGVLIYRRIFNPGSYVWAKEEKGVARSLDALFVFGV